MLDRIFFSVLEVSLSIGIVVAILLFTASLLNRRYAMKWKYFIWIFLAFRLVVPSDIADVQYMMGQMARTDSDIWRTASQIESADAAYSPGEARQRIVLKMPPQVNEPLMVSPETGTGKFTLLMVIEGVWIAGAVFFFAAHIGSYLYYKRQIMKEGKPVNDSHVLRQLTSLLHELQIKSKMRVVRYQNASSPMVTGFLRPVLVLPEKDYRPEVLFFILKHELVHRKRGDVWWKLLFVAANAVHWFNPVIWVMRKEAVVDMELSCDEIVMQGAGHADRKAYTETLLSMLHKQCRKGSTLTTQFYGGKQIMKKRFRNILCKTKGKNGLMIMLCAILLTGSLGMLIGCSVSGEDASFGNKGEEMTPGSGEAGTETEAEGIVADGIDVPDVVLECAEELVRDWYLAARENDEAANYRNWRIETLSHCFTYEEFHGMLLQVYQLNHAFLSDTPENISLVGGMDIREDGWVAPDYPDSKFLIFRQEGENLSFLTCLWENDCFPGDDLFNGDLENQLEDAGFLTTSESETPETITLTYTLEGEPEEEPAALFVGSGYSIYIPESYSLYAPDTWSYIYNEQIQFRVTYFEDQNLEQVQAELTSAYDMRIDPGVSGELEMAGQQENLILRVRLITFGQDVWGIFYSYPEEAIEGAGARLPVIVDTFAVTGEPEAGQE